MESPYKNEFMPDINMESKAELACLSMPMSKKQDIVDADLLEIEKRQSIDLDKEIIKEKFKHFYLLYLV